MHAAACEQECLCVNAGFEPGDDANWQCDDVDGMYGCVVGLVIDIVVGSCGWLRGWLAGSGSAQNLTIIIVFYLP